MKTGAVIMAAGMSFRMGTFKPMLPIAGEYVIDRVISTFLKAGVSPVAVVTGNQGEQLKQHIDQHFETKEVYCIYNERFDTSEMFVSATVGMNWIQHRCDRFFLTPVDIPLFQVDTVKTLMQSGARLVKPSFHGKGGHPLLIDCSLVPQLCQYESYKEGLKDAIRHTGVAMEWINVEDHGILLDIDTPQDYEAMIRLINE